MTEDPIDVHARELLDAVLDALPGFVQQVVADRSTARPGDPVATPAGVVEGVVDEVALRLGQLLAADVDDQATTPLAVIRSAMQPVTAELRRRGVVPVARDPLEERIAPDDPYGIGPVAFGDLSERAHVAGIAWGAAKAHVVLRRRRSDG